MTIDLSPKEIIFVFKSLRFKGLSPLAATALAALTAAALITTAPDAAAQTAPQLLPYTAKVLAGGGSTALTAGSTCQRTGATPSGNISTDTYANGCLATEIPSSELSPGTYGPRYALSDSTGAVYFGDFNNGMVRRIDPVTGVVTAVAGFGYTGSNPGAGSSCSAKDPHTSIAGDLYGDGCLGISVKLGSVSGLAINPSTGDLYISDKTYHNVRKMAMHNGGVAAVILNGVGSNYAAAPTVTFSAPPTGGTTATGTATISSGGNVTGVTITSAGSGYTAAPTVTFSASTTGTTATGTAVYTGVMSMVAGNYNGGGATSLDGFTAGCSTSAAPSTTLGSTCLLDAPYGLAFDNSGNLYIAEEYYEAILALNTGTSTTDIIYPNTSYAITLAPQILTTLVGARTPTNGATAPGPCLNGTGTTTTGLSGCNYGNYVNGMAATANYLDAPYGVAVDSNGNIFIADEYNNAVGEVTTGGILYNYEGLYPGSGTGAIQLVTKRGPSGTGLSVTSSGFTTGSDFGIAIDPSNNLYVTDSLSGYLWRVDATTQTEYVVGGGGTVCTAFIASPTDAYGDGCPARQATFSKSGTSYSSTGIFGVAADNYGDVFIGDEGNGLVREIASGTQFGSTGASATDYIDIHFAAGDTPITASGTAVPFAVSTTTPANATIFVAGTPTCTLNTDNNGTTNTTDCVLSVTASPTVSGPYAGLLTVKSNLVPAGTSFSLNGNFVQSPVTRLAVTSATSSPTCSGTTYATTTPVLLTASIVANGPYAPTGTVTFYTGTAGNLTQIGSSSLSTTAPYSATISNTVTTAGTYTITAIYTPPTGNYFLGSQSSATLTSEVAGFSLSNTGYQQASVTPGQTALYSFLISQGNYTGTIGFTVTGLPANSSYTISPTTVTGVGCLTTSTVALSILTQAQQVVTPGGLDGSGHGLARALSLIAGLGLALLIGLRRRRLPLRFAQIGMMLALFLVAGSTLGCGKAVGTVLQPATPASPANAPYTITVTPTTTVGTAPAPVTFSLTVL
jgi:streptogramin lyase